MKILNINYNKNKKKDNQINNEINNKIIKHENDIKIIQSNIINFNNIDNNISISFNNNNNNENNKSNINNEKIYTNNNYNPNNSNIDNINNNNHNDNNENNNKNNNNKNISNKINIINNNNGSKFNWFFIISILINILAVLYFVIKNALENKNNLTIVGIDFGSTFSGYSIIYNSDINFEDSDSNQVISSELIIDKETEIGLRIGNKAHYFSKNRIISENKLYFCKFKKNLDPKNVNNYAESNIPEGVKVNLENIIKGYLVLLKEEILMNNRIRNTNINDIKWILTVPPLWDDKGKKFMKEVAKKAGMINVEIALEPEAASLAIFHDKSIKKKFLETGKSFLLVDAGGYTVDISANKIMDKHHNLEQLIKPTSYTFGSNLINEKIIEIIEKVYGKDKIEQVKKNDYEAWEKTLDEIEEKKKEIDSNTAENFKIKIKFYKGKCSYMSDTCVGVFNGTKIPYSSTYIDIPSKIIIDIISEIAFNIVNQINRCFTKTNQNIDLIVLTGGFSNCKIFEQKIRDNFRGSLKELVFLKSPQETVMKGAVIFGLRPNQILYRISPITIGVDNYEYINQNSKCENQFKDADGDLRCFKFKKFVERGQSIKTNEIMESIIYPISREINIFYAYDEELNENSKNILDSLEIPSSDLSIKNRTISVSIKFGNYINITVFDKESNKGNWKVLYYPS